MINKELSESIGNDKYDMLNKTITASGDNHKQSQVLSFFKVA